MRIAVDARTYSWTGIGRYTRNLLKHLARLGTPHHWTVLVSAADAVLYQAQLKALGPRFTTQVVESSYYSWREQVFFLKQLYELDVDLIHFTHFNKPVLYRRPYVVTIHDVTRFIFPGQHHHTFGQQVAYEWVFSQAVQSARAVICVSKTTHQALQKLPLKLPDQLFTIYEGVDEQFLQPVSAVARQEARHFIGSPKPYLLFVGVWMSHKNIRRILYAFQDIHRRYPDRNLVITGKGRPGYVDVPAIARELDLTKHVIFPGFVDPLLLPALYAEAEALLFPSSYEGFGLPALEAAAVGTPVLIANTSSLPEVMGHAAVDVNPDSVTALANGIDYLLGSEPLRRRLSGEGKVRAAHFQWRTTAEETLRVYERASSF